MFIVRTAILRFWFSLPLKSAVSVWLRRDAGPEVSHLKVVFFSSFLTGQLMVHLTWKIWHDWRAAGGETTTPQLWPALKKWRAPQRALYYLIGISELFLHFLSLAKKWSVNILGALPSNTFRVSAATIVMFSCALTLLSQINMIRSAFLSFWGNKTYLS